LVAAVNVLYDVGSKDEATDKTGFAHLFEHLMFGGSANIPNFDRPVEFVGGENNAYTSCDVTCYYMTLPKANIETALWLESDRMLKLDFCQQSLEVQQQVVIEEYKQTYLNKPYGDVWGLLRKEVYKSHPYSWPTIGDGIAHVETATLEDVERFFYTHYAPDNAVLSVVVDFDSDYVFGLVEKWFGDIPGRNVKPRSIPEEPEQTAPRFLEVYRPVPFDNIYLAFRMCKRGDDAFIAHDLCSDVLSNGESSRLVQRLLRNKELFTYIDAYVTAEIETGLMIVTGTLLKGVSLADAERAIWEELELLLAEGLSDYEYQKLINKALSSLIYSEIDPMSKAMMLASSELRGDASLINTEADRYLSTTKEEVELAAKSVFRKENCTTLWYRADGTV
jgi:predicted Zn-dependent peptidase